MNFTGPKLENTYFGELSIENIYIAELIPMAPGDYVRVYLYARWLAANDTAMTKAGMAEMLATDEKTIDGAWDFWEDCGAIRKRYFDDEDRLDFTVEFVSLRDQLFGAGTKEKEFAPDVREGEEVRPVSSFGNEEIVKLMKKLESKMARTLSSSDMKCVISWVDDLKMTPEVINAAVDYCLGKNKMSFNYISKVIEGWAQDGIRTADEVRAHLESNDRKFFSYRRVMKALGFSRNPSEEEQRIMDTWFDDIGYNMDKVLEACAKTAGISNPNIKYVDSVLRNWESEAKTQGRGVNEKKPVSARVLNEYFDLLRQKAEDEAEERRREVYERLPEIKEIDDKIKELGMKLSRALITNGDQSTGRKLSEEMEQMNTDRAVIMAENDFDIDYTDVRYKCSKCSDTGITDLGVRCTCMEQRMQEAEIWQQQKGKEKRK